jgi:hypothetical protein
LFFEWGIGIEDFLHTRKGSGEVDDGDDVAGSVDVAIAVAVVVLGIDFGAPGAVAFVVDGGGGDVGGVSAAVVVGAVTCDVDVVDVAATSSADDKTNDCSSYLIISTWASLISGVKVVTLSSRII